MKYGKTPWTKYLSSDDTVEVYFWGGGGRICLYFTDPSTVANGRIGVHFPPLHQPTGLCVYSVLIYIWVSHSSTFMVSQQKQPLLGFNSYDLS